MRTAPARSPPDGAVPWNYLRLRYYVRSGGCGPCDFPSAVRKLNNFANMGFIPIDCNMRFVRHPWMLRRMHSGALQPDR